MRIALILERLPDTGGGFHLELSTIESLVRSPATRHHEFVVFVQFERTRQRLLECGIEPIFFRQRGLRLIDRWSATVLGGAILRRLRKLGFPRLGRHLDALLDDHNIDLVLLPEPGNVVWRIGDHPFIVTIWDLDHRNHPEFPEVYGERAFERRERQLRAALPRAMAVIVDTPSLARQIAGTYQLDPSRIVVLPFLVPVATRRYIAKKDSLSAQQIRLRYGLPDRYVFYPAYFSFHKNHLYLLEAMRELEKQHGIPLHAVFCGGHDAPIEKRIEQQVAALGLRERVHFIGFVPDEDVPALHEGAVAMVMPSYFGPTNVPPLEAAAVGCPVVCSDFPGCREQMGDAALYCDLSDPTSLADHLAALINDQSLRDRLRTAGYQLAEKLGNVDYGERLARVLDRYAYIRRRWAWPDRTGR
jgi:glycosyltransferase involved in cell wall biosynthesis